MKPKRRLFPLRWWLQVASLLAIIAGILLWNPSRCRLEAINQTLAPGLTLTKLAQHTPGGDTQVYLVRGQRASGWRFKLATAQGSVMQRETVTAIAQRTGAAAAVNGGFFAYQGAALGAVKVDGEWLRLPWKNRTAIGFKDDGTAHIANLRGVLKITIYGVTREAAALNGNAPKDGFAILTPRYGTIYNLRADEYAYEADHGQIRAVVFGGAVNIRADGFVIVAHGAARHAFPFVLMGLAASWKIVTTPDDWDDYPTILGAGPRLVTNGLAAEASREEEFRPDVIQRGPRSAVGVDAEGNPLFVVADGRFAGADGRIACSPGLTLPELAALMASLGVRDALHMDCGPSSVLVLSGQVANRPMGNQPSGLNEPTVPNAVLISREEGPVKD